MPTEPAEALERLRQLLLEHPQRAAEFSQLLEQQHAQAQAREVADQAYVMLANEPAARLAQALVSLQGLVYWMHAKNLTPSQQVIERLLADAHTRALVESEKDTAEASAAEVQWAP